MQKRIIKKRPYSRPKEPYRINHYIRAPEVRVVGEGLTPGIYPIATALEMAQAKGLDLVEISAKTSPPVCKIIDYDKFKFQQKKKQKELKSKAQKAIVKEVLFTPATGDNDIAFKAKHIISFLQDGAKVKAYVRFRGRQLAFKEKGQEVLNKAIKAVEPYGKAEHLPKMEHRKMILTIIPTLTNKK